MADTGPATTTKQAPPPVVADVSHQAQPTEPDLVGRREDELPKPTEPTGPTDSHVLAQVDPEEKGVVHHAGETDEVTDLGWGSSPEQIPEQLVPGLSNEDLWMLIRRFNKQLYCVKAVPYTPLQKLDLNRAEDEEFSPDKLRATLERFYTTVVVSLTAFVKHIARLRSWREPRRTAAFCSVYFIAWAVDLLVPAVSALLIVLVLYPPSREFLFPPAPIALVDSSTGGVRKPKAGVLGSHDSITGAPQKFKGEAAEQEASNLVSSVAGVAVGSAAGKHDQGAPDDAPMEDSVPDAMDAVSRAADAQSAAQGEVPAHSHDKSRWPMNQDVLKGANMAMRVVSDITDTYERFGNALSPTPPFHRLNPRLRLAGVLTAGLLASTFTSSYMLVKMTEFVVGFGFFGDPVLMRAAHYLNHKFPHWQKLLELQNSLLKGIPTNAQLTITLLRIGERNHAPLPPPPSAPHEKPPTRPASLNHEELTLDASKEEIDQAAAVDPNIHDDDHGNTQQSSKAKRSFGARILGFFRGTTATGVESKYAVDQLRASMGSKPAKDRLGTLEKKGQITLPMGPIEFNGRFNGKRGAAVIDSARDPPLLYFTTEPIRDASDLSVESRKSGSVLFTIPVTEIQEMRKLGGMGWKGKLVVGWAIGSKEVVDGLLITGKLPGQTYHLTAMRRRDELFNRLIAIDGQVWESR